MSAWGPVFTPACTLRIERKRANTCAVVMKSSVDAPTRTTSSIATSAFRESSTKFACVRMQPFGRPVVPDV